ncbi:hypothetical protein BN12_1630008 [Nostocoides japonicum T1-X7]|uniref:Uncharacterized protein n=1 Tax=Nostocoides japonicum T1-X7 TaxID=1194083 RepID=A0A077LYQ1_9MICO|nr:hypothetical protein BN12_1630008 [Tetrasphaera japonica T1-X7]
MARDPARHRLVRADGDTGAGPLARLDEARREELVVGGDDGAPADPERRRERPRRGQLVTGSQAAGSDEVEERLPDAMAERLGRVRQPDREVDDVRGAGHTADDTGFLVCRYVDIEEGPVSWSNGARGIREPPPGARPHRA